MGELEEKSRFLKERTRDKIVLGNSQVTSGAVTLGQINPFCKQMLLQLTLSEPHTAKMRVEFGLASPAGEGRYKPVVNRDCLSSFTCIYKLLTN